MHLGFCSCSSGGGTACRKLARQRCTRCPTYKAGFVLLLITKHETTTTAPARVVFLTHSHSENGGGVVRPDFRCGLHRITTIVTTTVFPIRNQDHDAKRRRMRVHQLRACLYSWRGHLRRVVSVIARLYLKGYNQIKDETTPH